MISQKPRIGHGSFDLKLWPQAAKIERTILEKCDMQRRISHGIFGCIYQTCIKTDEAKGIRERIQGHEQILAKSWLTS